MMMAAVSEEICHDPNRVEFATTMIARTREIDPSVNISVVATVVLKGISIEMRISSY